VTHRLRGPGRAGTGSHGDRERLAHIVTAAASALASTRPASRSGHRSPSRTGRWSLPLGRLIDGRLAGDDRPLRPRDARLGPSPVTVTRTLLVCVVLRFDEGDSRPSDICPGSQPQRYALCPGTSPPRRRGPRSRCRLFRTPNRGLRVGSPDVERARSFRSVPSVSITMPGRRFSRRGTDTDIS